MDLGNDMPRKILHVDMNCYYASVAQHRDPSLRGLPVAVAGDPEKRNGIILAKSKQAKAFGVKTGEAIWQAKEKCPSLILVPPDYQAYKRYSRIARSIYYEYTDLVEPFGLDECWMDVTGSLHLLGGSIGLVAQEISERVKAELGLTVSVGVSWNKVFAKLGSDTDSGDGISFITPDNYREKVWPLNASELIYIGRATTKKLRSVGIVTIGDVARADPVLIRSMFGKIGIALQGFARGQDESSVKPLDVCAMDTRREMKSIGNSLTAPHDIECEEDAKALIWLLSESVAQRLRLARMKAQVVAISVRSAEDLRSYTRQSKLRFPTCITDEIANTAIELLQRNEKLDGSRRLRSLGVRAASLVPLEFPVQFDLFGPEGEQEHRTKMERLDFTIDELRRRFGNKSVCRLVELSDSEMASVDIERDNTVHPVGFFGG